MTFTYTATDDSGAANATSTVKTVTITVTGTNDQPVASDIVINAVEDGATVNGNFVVSDVDVNNTPDTHTFAIVTDLSAGEGTVTNNGNGTFTYDPGSDFQDLGEGETRDVTFTYTATDDSGAANATSTVKTVTITVTGANDSPVIVAMNNASALTAINEDILSAANTGQAVSSLIEFNSTGDANLADVTDIDASASLQGVAIVGNAAIAGEGTWQYDNSGTWVDILTTASESNAILINAATLIRFNPAPDYNGDPGSLTFRAVDNTATVFVDGDSIDLSGGGATGGITPYSTDTGTMDVTVNAVNDAPVIQNNVSLNPINEDPVSNPGQTISSFLALGSDVTDVDTGASLSGVVIISNPANAVTQGSWQFSTDGGSTWLDIGVSSVAASVALSESTLLRFDPVQDYNGTTDLIFRALDDTFTGSFSDSTAMIQTVDTTLNGGTTAISSSVGLMELEVNDAPILSTNLELLALHNGTTATNVIIDNSLLNTTDVDTPAGSITYTVTTNVANGTLYMDANNNDMYDSGEDVTSFTQADIDSGSIQYVTNETGTNFTQDSFVFDMSDGVNPAISDTFHIAVGVNTTADTPADNTDGILSLRDAVSIANSATSDVSVILQNATYLLGGTELSLNNANAAISIDGIDSTIDAQGNSRVLNVTGASTNVTINDMTITGGNSIMDGGGISNNSGASFTANNSSISGNTASFFGGGIYNQNADLTLNNSTISNNDATFEGGGVYNDQSNFVANNSTISNNAADNIGGGVYNFSSDFTASNSTISSNDASDGGGIYNDMSSNVTTNSTIIVGNTATTNNEINNDGGTVVLTDSLQGGVNLNGLGIATVANVFGTNVLADNGGPTQTIALSSTSIAINNGVAGGPGADDEFADQRGVVYVGQTDIGAYEAENPNSAPVVVNGKSFPITQESNISTIQSISSLLLFGTDITDVDSMSSMSGVAIVSNPANEVTEGTWEFSTDSGVSWMDVGVASDGAGAVALSESTEVRFNPASGYFGLAPALEFRALDNTYTSGFSTSNPVSIINVDTTSNGGATSISANTGTIDIIVNGTPIAADDAVSLEQYDSASGNVLTDGTADSDPDGDLLTVIEVNGNPANVGTNILLPSTADLTLNSDGSYTYDSNFSLFPGDMDSFTYTISDGKGGSDTATVNITITAVAPPVVLDLDGDGIELVSAEDSAVTWVDEQGNEFGTGWVSPDDALLVFDANQDGQFSGLEEIELVNYHPDAKTDLEGLALAFDSNQDGVFDMQDNQFEQFAIWQDANQDGISQANEYTPIVDSNVDSINLTSDDVVEIVEGNTIYGTASYVDKEGNMFDVGDVGLQIQSVLDDTETDSLESLGETQNDSTEQASLPVESDNSAPTQDQTFSITIEQQNNPDDFGV